MRAGVIITLLLLFVVGAAPNAWAQVATIDDLSDSEAERALELAEAAEGFELEGDWAAAQEAYAELLVLLPEDDRYTFRHNLCREALGDYHEALLAYERLLSSTNRNVLRNAMARIAVLTDLLHLRQATLVFDIEPLGAAVNIDDVSLGLVEEGQLAFDVSPGRHVVQLELEGYEDVHEAVVIRPGQEFFFTARFEPSVSEVDTPDAPTLPPEPNIIPTVVFGGMALFAGGLGTAYAVLSAHVAQEERNLDRSDPTNSRAESDALVEDANRYATISTVSFIVAATSAATAVVLYFVLNSGDDETASSVTPIGLQPVVGPDVVGLDLSWTF